MPARSRSNPLALAVLVTLYERPMHPYEVAQTLRQRAKQESVRLNYGSLYGVVESLERRGLIRALETMREGKRPERTIYEITDKGSREVVEWMTELIEVPVKEYPQFMAVLSFIGALHPDDALSALRTRAEGLALRLASMRGAMRAAQEAGLPRIFELETEYEEQQLQSELHFVNALIKDMANGSLEGLDMWRTFHADGFKPFEEVTFTLNPHAQ